MNEHTDGLHKPFPFASGSSEKPEHDLDAVGYEIKKNELYVIGGDTLIRAYKLLSAQRISTLLQINHTPPTFTKEIENYIGIFNHVNKTMYDILNAILYKKLKDMDDEERKNKGDKPRRVPLTSKSGEADFSSFMEDFLKRNKISLDGNINDDGNTPLPPDSEN